MRKVTLIAIFLFLLVGCDNNTSVQIPDRSYTPPIINPAYERGKGPLVCLDEAHNNFHTLNGRFWTFGELLRRDGYKVKANKKNFSEVVLDRCDILVIANAQLDMENWNDYPYPTPSAFSDDEIYVVQTWAENGGSLLLIADHIPLAGAASDLALAFGVEFNNGYALKKVDGDENPYVGGEIPTIFSLDDGTLPNHPITEGRTPDEAVTSIRSFTGQAFLVPASAQPLMILPNDFISVMPEKPWTYIPETKEISVGGWLQGAVMPYRLGRAVFLGGRRPCSQRK